MARSVRGRLHHGSLPSWPPLRVRALVNGLCLTVFGSALLYLTWSMLGFRVYDAAGTALVLRVLAVWFAVGLPTGCLAIGLHMVFTAITSTDRLLLAHGAASWDPGDQDDVLRGMRVRNWRPTRGPESGAFSARTLGWVHVQTPVVLAPLVAGVVATVGLMIWMATGYGGASLILLAALAWIGWRAWRAWTALQDYQVDRRRRGADPAGRRRGGTSDAGAGSDAVVTADEAWDDDEPAYQPPPHPDPYQRELQLRQAMADDEHRGGSNDIRVEASRRHDDDVEDATDLIPVYRDPDHGPEYAGRDHREDRRGRRAPGRTPRKSDRGPDTEPQVVLVDRSAERARRARQRKNGADAAAETTAARGSSRRGDAREGSGAAAGRGRSKGLRSRFGERATTDAPRDTPPSRAPARRRTGAPSKAEAERDIYERRDEASSIFGYMWRRPKDD